MHKHEVVQALCADSGSLHEVGVLLLSLVSVQEVVLKSISESSAESTRSPQSQAPHRKMHPGGPCSSGLIQALTVSEAQEERP